MITRTMATKTYTFDSIIVPSKDRVEIFIEKTDNTNFYHTVKNYVGAFLNTCGGIIHFGVKKTGRVVGVSCNRAKEDQYRLELDNIIKFIQPKVSPTLYRLHFISVKSAYYVSEYKVLSLHVSAGTDIMYMDSSERVMTMSSAGLYGPLIPQEIQRLAIHKYKQELLNAENLMKVITPCPREGRHSKKLAKKRKSFNRMRDSPPPKKTTTCTLSTQTTPKPQLPSLADVLSTQTTPGLTNNAAVDHIDDLQLTVRRTTQQSQENHTNKVPTSTPLTHNESGMIVFDLDSTVISIDSDSDTSVIILDQTGDATPVRNPSDLFASPDCSTTKKNPQERPVPTSPSQFPEKPRIRNVAESNMNSKAVNAIKLTISEVVPAQNKTKLRKS